MSLNRVAPAFRRMGNIIMSHAGASLDFKSNTDLVTLHGIPVHSSGSIALVKNCVIQVRL
jgi:hypothetical protein